MKLPSVSFSQCRIQRWLAGRLRQIYRKISDNLKEQTVPNGTSPRCGCWPFMSDAAKSKIVLIVEDEVLVNLDAAEALRDSGFEPVQTYTAEEAIIVLEARSDIRFVFTDVNLPGKIDGITLAAEIQRRWPQIEVLLTSGGQRQPRLDHLALARLHGRFVAKPYRADVVARRIHDIIDAKAA
jgi:two-component system, response regulator PdtaR